MYGINGFNWNDENLIGNIMKLQNTGKDDIDSGNSER